MQAFILETLAGREWRPGGRIYWTADVARRKAQRLVSAGKAVAVRILTADVEPQPVEDIRTAQTGKGGSQ